MANRAPANRRTGVGHNAQMPRRTSSRGEELSGIDNVLKQSTASTCSGAPSVVHETSHCRAAREALPLPPLNIAFLIVGTVSSPWRRPTRAAPGPVARREP